MAPFSHVGSLTPFNSLNPKLVTCLCKTAPFDPGKPFIPK